MIPMVANRTPIIEELPPMDFPMNTNDQLKKSRLTKMRAFLPRFESSFLFGVPPPIIEPDSSTYSDSSPSKKSSIFPPSPGSK